MHALCAEVTRAHGAVTINFPANPISGTDDTRS